MSIGSEEIGKSVVRENNLLEQILEGIVEGIEEGITEGVSDGLRQGFKGGIQDCLSGNFDESDFSEVLPEILEDSAFKALRKRAGNAVSRPAEIYMRRVCGHIVAELTNWEVKLTEKELGALADTIMETEKRILKELSEVLPDNPFVREICNGIQSAFEESLQKEVASCQERLRQIE
jgi:hypothetical protein